MAKIPERMTVQQAYTAMIFFLEGRYELTDSDEIGGLLGSMQLLEDGKPADPALWHDWLKAVENISD
jgi:hypothetical protein